jgi:hypothetical protein
MKNYEDEAFDELEKSLQRNVATGVTDGSKLGTHEVLRIMPDGEFIWHPEADAMIEKGDFSSSPGLPHMLRVLRKSEKKDAALRLAREALIDGDWYIGQLEMIVYSFDDNEMHSIRSKVKKAIKAIDEALEDK